MGEVGEVVELIRKHPSHELHKVAGVVDAHYREARRSALAVWVLRTGDF